MVEKAFLAREQLAAKGVQVSVYDFHTIRPLDTNTLDSLQSKELIVTLEEHSVAGGFGSAVAEYYSMLPVRPRLLLLGCDGMYQKAGSYNYLLEQYGLTADKITDRILATID